MAKKAGTMRNAPRAPTKPVEKPVNPFEQLYNKKKFNVLGKRTKGEHRRPASSRAGAVEKRKHGLLVEYKQLKKSNTFDDRRFGEHDDTLLPEERAIARFQKQRLKESASSMYALEEDPEAQLTHLGRTLDLADDDGFLQAAEERNGRDDDEGDLGAALVREFHFSGNGQSKQSEADHNQDGDVTTPPRKRSKAEVMEDVMAKSKAFRVAKQQQREEDLKATEDLDASFAKLVKGGGLVAMLRPKGLRHSKAAQAPEAGGGDEFDRMRRELAFEARAGVSERMLTEEEAASRRDRLAAAAEAARIARMRDEDAGAASDADPDMDEKLAGLALPAGGYAARRAKRARLEAKASRAEQPSGDALDENFALTSESGSDTDGSGSDGGPEGPNGSLQARQAARAAGDHPLQRRMRKASAALLSKYGVAVQGLAEGSSEAEEEGCEEESDGEEGDDADAQLSEGGSEEDEAAKYGRSDSALGGKAGSSDDADSGSGNHSELVHEAGNAPALEPGVRQQEDRAAETAACKRPVHDVEEADAGASRGGPGGIAERQNGTAALDLNVPGSSPEANRARLRRSVCPNGLGPPSLQQLPRSYAEFAEAVEGLSADALDIHISGLRTSNAAALRGANRHELQGLYGILMQHFAMRAAVQPLSMDELDTLTGHLADLTPQVPLYAAAAARARLQRMQHRLERVLQEPWALVEGGGGLWPPPRTLLVLQLWALLFPASDRHHAVLTPAALLVGAYLTHCPLMRLGDIAIGLLLATLGLHLAAPAARVMPEALAFATSLLQSAQPPVSDVRPPSGSPSHAPAAMPDTRSPAEEQLPWERAGSQGWLHPSGGWGHARLPGGLAPPLDVARVLSTPLSDPYFAGSTFKASALAATLGLVTRTAQALDGLESLPELLAPARAALKALADAGLPMGLETARREAAEVVAGACKAAAAARLPLQRAPAAREADVKLFNPRFEDDYAAGRDFDPDRERAAARRLRRQVQKERRGAMRELRKDAVFLADVKEREAAAIKVARRAELRSNNALLERQEADFKSGGQGGLWKKGRRPKA